METLEDWLGWETWRDQFTLLSVGAICPVSWTPTSCGWEKILEDIGPREGMLLRSPWTCPCSGPVDSYRP